MLYLKCVKQGCEGDYKMIERTEVLSSPFALHLRELRETLKTNAVLASDLDSFQVAGFNHPANLSATKQPRGMGNEYGGNRSAADWQHP